jgi:predicted porin
MSQKKRLFAVAALSMASAAAMAQTSVSLYGIVDAAVRSESTVTAGTNGGHVKGLAAGGMSQSRLGVNISEDMGDGWRAVANIEHRLMSDTGAQSPRRLTSGARPGWVSSPRSAASRWAASTTCCST